MVDNNFFDESREQSQIKARIVTKYFWAWAKVISPSTRARGNRIAYIDLFAGPGRYEDGTEGSIRRKTRVDGEPSRHCESTWAVYSETPIIVSVRTSMAVAVYAQS